jgi:hypothetical protein
MSTVNINNTTSTVVVSPSATSTQVVQVITSGPKGNTGETGLQGPVGVLPTTGSFPFSGSINLTGSLNITQGQVLVSGQVLASDKVNTSVFDSFTSSYYQDSSSFDTRIDSITFDSSSLLLTSSFNNYTSSVSSRLVSLEQSTGSFAITGSNTFLGNQIVTGSLLISGSGTLNGGTIVSSNTVLKIETITSASYAALVSPVSGTLYIIVG